LYEARLLNDHLLPLTSVVEPDLEEEVKALLKDVGKRAGTAHVTSQMDPWAPTDKADVWWCTELAIDGLPLLHMITRIRLGELSDDECPTLYRARHGHLKVGICAVAMVDLSSERITKAREFTRRILWELYGSRMRWDNLDFAYLFLPASDVHEPVEWMTRRSWLDDLNAREGRTNREAANAEVFGERFSFPTDLTIVRERGQGAKSFRFLRWRFEPVSLEEEEVLRERYHFPIDDQIVPPFLVVQRMPRRMNFLSIEEAAKSIEREGKYSTETELLLRSRFSTVSLMSAIDTDYALFIPSIIRYLSLAMTVASLRRTLLTPTLAGIPLSLLQAAITAPVSQEPLNYQRLETLGDTVLKFIVGIQLLAEYPLWHEGYLTKKKDHSVSNYRLAKEAHAKKLYRWIIRNRFLAQKWKPEYFLSQTEGKKPEWDSNNSQDVERISDDNQELSTKMLADVGMSLMSLPSKYLLTPSVT
jgi:dsRNA-specific ribonuclease